MKTKFINKEVPESILEIIEQLKSSIDCSYCGISMNAEDRDKLCNWFDSLENKFTEDEPSVDYEFEVGDLVEVMGHPSGDNTKWDYTEGFDNSWVNDMNEDIGRECLIKGINGAGITLKENQWFAFPPQSLKLIKKANSTINK